VERRRQRQMCIRDSPIAIGILAVTTQVKATRLSELILLGELSLDGSIQRTKGVLAIALQAKAEGFKGLIVPSENAAEAAIVQGLEIYGVKNILEVISLLNGKSGISPTPTIGPEEFGQLAAHSLIDFAEVKGQMHVKRAFEIAAAGSHNLILVGPPGAGKSMLAKRLPTILPPMTLEEALETTKIHSVAGKKRSAGIVSQRPFRKPHHTISDIGLIGGGSYPQPGEISLAHNGVLFLDELPEYKRHVLEVLRQPLEDRAVNISRARFSIDYPANFMLVAAMNPCPCGFLNHPEKACGCHPTAVQRYLQRVSGPLLDRIDMHIEVSPVKYTELNQSAAAESSQEIRLRILAARKIQQQRYLDTGLHANAHMSRKQVEAFCQLSPESQKMLQSAMKKLGLSARAYERILKVARTIADLDASPMISTAHLSEAIQYRNLDRSN
jgi:magnesium chelatase family protein